jgi:8-oxo-dGTP pyrophosphatase MutT (NUDIX family)
MNEPSPDQLQRLNRLEADASHPYRRPKDAATLIVIDRKGPEPKVLFGKRHEGHVFMPGMFVFPGGRLERTDRLMSAASELDADTVRKLTAHTGGATPGKARALALTAVRETFEETGLMLGEKRADAPRVPGGPWSAFAQAKVYPRLSDIHFIARAITPPGRPRRFDTRFFAVDAEAVAHRVEGVVSASSELTELVWVPLSQTKGLGLLNITTVVLEELETRTRAGLSHALPVPFFRVLNRRFVKETL